MTLDNSRNVKMLVQVPRGHYAWRFSLGACQGFAGLQCTKWYTFTKISLKGALFESVQQSSQSFAQIYSLPPKRSELQQFQKLELKYRCDLRHHFVTGCQVKCEETSE